MPRPDTGVQSPGDFIRDELKSRGWTQADLAQVIDRPLPTVNRIIQGQHAILPEMAIALGAAFGTDPEIWMSREAAYRLSLADGDGAEVQRRVRLYSLAPVNEIQKRGWIHPGKDLKTIEADVLQLFEITDATHEPIALGPMRKTGAEEVLTSGQLAWCYRVRQLAKMVPSAPYDDSRLPACERAIRKLAAYPQEAAKLPEVFGSFGIRFVVVEPLTGTKVDGVALWLDEASPVIGVSVRHDRIDAFWFTVCHELAHIRNRDQVAVDSEIAEHDAIQMTVKSPVERRADEQSAATLIDPDELKSFIRRVGPLYSKQSIIQFAHRIKVHPGIIVGQLQHRGEIHFRANREMLSKIRETVTSTALTDGWGNTIPLGANA